MDPARENPTPMPELLDIVGQDDAVARLQTVLHSQRMPHSLLFTGPEGVGRRTAALALAKTLLCEHPVTRPNADGLLGERRLPEMPDDAPLRQACGHCPDCRMMAANSHPDFQLVHKELAAFHEDANVRNRVMQELGIEVIRSFLIAPVGRRSNRGRGKVFVIREADLMSAAAQNAMLKTLEEPPPGVTIILLAQKAEELLPTTLSRCWKVNFGLLPRPFVTQRLIAQGIDENQAQYWAAFTEGSLGRSLRMAHAGIYEVKLDMIQKIAAMNRAGDAELGETLVKTTDKLAEALVKTTRTGETEMSKNLALRQTVGIMLELIAGAYRDALALSGGSDRPLINQDQRPAIEGLVHKFTAIQLADVIEQLSELEQLLWRNVNHKTIWDNVVISCASAAPLWQ